jgi:hypothetical protein
VQSYAISLARADSLPRIAGQERSALKARRKAEAELWCNAQVERQAAA